MEFQRLSISAALSTIFAPSSVAIFGASDDRTKLGHAAVKLLKEGGFAGEITPINPKGGSVLGLPVRKSLEATGERVDVALSFVPAEQMLSALEASEAAGVKVFVAVTSGFAESGNAGAQYEHQLREFIAHSHMRIIGPNCEGVIVPSSNLLLTFSPMFLDLRPGHVAIVSQSGAISGMMASRLSKLGVGIRAVITTGNEADITAGDVIDWLADDPLTETILMYIEEIRHADRFVAAARRLQGRKKIVINKVGRSSVGRRAAESHTGALAGDDRVISGVFKEFGILRANDTQSAIDAAAALSLGKPMRGGRLGVVSIVGGLAVETAELAEIGGFSVPLFGAELRERLDRHLPFFGSSRNPVDLTGAVLQRPEMMQNVLRDVLEDASVDAVIVVVTFARHLDFARSIVDAARTSEKPLLVCWTGGVEQTPEALNYLRDEGIPIFDAPVRVVGALTAIARASGLRLERR